MQARAKRERDSAKPHAKRERDSAKPQWMRAAIKKMKILVLNSGSGSQKTCLSVLPNTISRPPIPEPGSS
jgi:hypothetical protein